MDVEKREWAVNPPREPMTTLAALVRDFAWRFPRDRRDMVWDFCKSAPNLVAAIDRACASLNAEGKMHNHQSRVPRASKDEFARLIKEGCLDEIRGRMRRGKRRGYEPFTFDDLFDLLKSVQPRGVGPVMLYDVATRIGAYLDVHPTSLYLHAGVRSGITMLDTALPDRTGSRHLNAGQRAQVWRKIDRVPQSYLEEWWPEFNGMTPDEVEDFLCTYRLVFDKLEG